MSTRPSADWPSRRNRGSPLECCRSGPSRASASRKTATASSNDTPWFAADARVGTRNVLRVVDRAMEREAAGEVGELPAKNQPAAVEPRLERLIFQPQHGAGFLRRQAPDVAQHDRRAIDGGQREDGARDAAAELRLEDVLV